MANTYYDSTLTAEEIEAALTAIDGIIDPVNNGKIIAVENGSLVAKSVTEYTEQPVLITKNINANGNYSASSDDADGYSSVAVNVPNSYSQSDEGKVVSNGALVAQTARSSQITQNGTYDTTLNNSVQVNVSGGGGGNRYVESFENGTLIYVYDDDGPRVYFNGYTKVQGDVAFPSGFPVPSGLDQAKAYGSDKTTQIGWIGWYQNKIRSWTMDTTQLLAGTFWGVCYIGDGLEQDNPYEEPPSEFVMVSKTVTQNGTYNPADDNADGYSEVVVNVGPSNFASGTFVTADTQYGIVDVDCGFKPDMVMVTLPFSSGNTIAWWSKDIKNANTLSVWDLRPTESNSYTPSLGRSSGETGIQAINNDGFSFMSNASNTRGVTCTYIAVKL